MSRRWIASVNPLGYVSDIREGTEDSFNPLSVGGLLFAESEDETSALEDEHGDDDDSGDEMRDEINLIVGESAKGSNCFNRRNDFSSSL